MAENETYYRPGLLFLAKAPGYVLHVRDDVFHAPLPDGSRELARPALVADFGEGLTAPVAQMVADDGTPLTPYETLGAEFAQRMQFADVRGGAFDLDAAAQRYEWTEEEREFVARRMLRLCARPEFTDFRLWEPVAPGPPWPTYDDAHHFRVAALAEELGLVPEALAYERATKNRSSVVEGLEAKLGEQAVEAELTAV